jgi:hypothetical protein
MDLEQTITDAVNDSLTEGDTPDVDVVEEASPEPVEAPESDSPVEPAPEVEASAEVPSPAATEVPEPKVEEPQDDFAKLAGIRQMGVGGRENRIPYSRVKKITEKAVADKVSEVAEAALGRKLNSGEKAVDVVKAHVAKLPELEAKVTDYESRLSAVGQFEDVMANDPRKFLGILAKIPAYKEFFEFIDQGAQALQKLQTQPQIAAQQQTGSLPDDMPEPDQELEDGSKVYSLDGLKSLLAWQGAQTENRVKSTYEKQLKEMQDRYAPIETDWQERRRTEAVLPVIRKKIEEARTWPLFNESEQEILAKLQEDKQISLDDAYRMVVFPKLVSERNKVRQEVIAEVKKAPTSTAVTSRAGGKPTQQAGPRSIEDIIRDQIATLKK